MQPTQAEGRTVGKSTATWVWLLAAFFLAACVERPDADQIAQATMIGLSKRDILACMGEPVRRRAVGEGTEIWTFAPLPQTTDTPPWAAGLNLAASAPPGACAVRIVLTNARVSQIGYATPDGQGLPSGRQCGFAVRPCAEMRALN